MIKSQELKKAKRQPKKQSDKKPSKKRFDIKYIIMALLTVISIVASYIGYDGYNKEPEVIENVEIVEKPVLEAPTVELSEEPAEVVIENADGSEEIVELPAVEQADANISIGTDEIDGGRGEYFPAGTPEEFKNAVLGRCIDVDGAWGSQCWDASSALFYGLTGRHLSTCGTGAAKGAWNCKEQNAGEDFVLVTDPNSLQAGDILIFNGGIYGHTGMALGSAQNGYVALLGANQGGGYCEGGGAAVNIVAYSMKDFVGAFRYKGWTKVEEAPKTGHQYIIKEEVK